jgi:hypothetical protein
MTRICQPNPGETLQGFIARQICAGTTRGRKWEDYLEDHIAAREVQENAEAILSES